MSILQCVAAVVLMVISVTAQLDPILTDSDHDGVPDHRDQCPDTAQMNKVPAEFKYSGALSKQRSSATDRAWPADGNGCELDSDGDGIVDSRDYCPDDTAQALVAGITDKGCPLQSDADGTPDWRDRCPGTPGGVSTDRYGCPKIENSGSGIFYKG